MTLSAKFTLLIVPFGGPFDGKDMDGEFFSERTDLHPEWHSEWPVLWHHGQDPLGRIGSTPIGKAGNLRKTAMGWTVEVEMGDSPEARLVQRLGEHATIYGSSGTIGSHVRRSRSGEILSWPMAEISLSAAPQNPYSQIV
jgi:hypothetical protein